MKLLRNKLDKKLPSLKHDINNTLNSFTSSEMKKLDRTFKKKSTLQPEELPRDPNDLKMMMDSEPMAQYANTKILKYSKGIFKRKKQDEHSVNGSVLKVGKKDSILGDSPN